MKPRPATVEDVHALAQAMPHVTRIDGSKGKLVYQVGGKSFIFFRNPRPDAKDPETGERYNDVIVIWVESEAEKLSLINEPGSPFFTTDHFNGHDSVLIRERNLEAITYEELKEIIADAWLSRASARRGADWLRSQADLSRTSACFSNNEEPVSSSVGSDPISSSTEKGNCVSIHGIGAVTEHASWPSEHGQLSWRSRVAVSEQIHSSAMSPSAMR